eukprot:1226571-Prymnesium_polylepis.1
MLQLRSCSFGVKPRMIAGVRASSRTAALNRLQQRAVSPGDLLSSLKPALRAEQRTCTAHHIARAAVRSTLYSNLSAQPAKPETKEVLNCIRNCDKALTIASGSAGGQLFWVRPVGHASSQLKVRSQAGE